MVRTDSSFLPTSIMKLNQRGCTLPTLSSSLLLEGCGGTELQACAGGKGLSSLLDWSWAPSDLGAPLSRVTCQGL